MDIDSFELEIECPKCRFYNMIWIKQARLRDVVICRGCKSNICLDDNTNDVRKARRRINSALDGLKKQFERLNR